MAGIILIYMALGNIRYAWFLNFIFISFIAGIILIYIALGNIHYAISYNYTSWSFLPPNPT